MKANHVQASTGNPSEDTDMTANVDIQENSQEKQGEIQQLIHQLALKGDENASLRSSLESQLIRCTSMLQEKEIQLQEKDRQLQELLQDKDKQLKEKDKQLIEKDRQLIEKDRQLIEKDKQLIEKDKQLEKRATQLYEAVSQLQEAVRDLQKQQQQLQDKDKILNEKAEEIKNKDRQLQEALIQLQKKERQREEWWQQIACNVQKHEKLASGAWGVVYKGILPVAIKELKSTAPQSLQLFRREKEAAFFCHHCNIVQFWGAGKDLRLCPNIVMELMDGNLRDFIKHQNYRMQQKDIVSIALDVAKGLSYLHQHNPPILHRDLKTDNILLKRGTAKIGDLGSAKFQRDNMTWNCGTYIYTAPEVLNSNIQTPKMDVWSYGLVVQEMATGERPNPSKLAEQVQQVTCPKLKELVTACTQIQPDQRPSMPAVVKFLKEKFP